MSLETPYKLSITYFFESFRIFLGILKQLQFAVYDLFYLPGLSIRDPLHSNGAIIIGLMKEEFNSAVAEKPRYYTPYPTLHEVKYQNTYMIDSLHFQLLVL